MRYSHGNAVMLRARTLARRMAAASQRTLATRKPREKTYSIAGRTSGTTSMSQARDHTFRSDTPPSGGGHDTAPQPVEMLLAALIGCEGATADFVARMLRTKVLSIDFELEASRDPRGAAHLPIDEPAPAVSRLARISGLAHVTLDRPSTGRPSDDVQAADDALIAKLGALVHERCPVANMVVASGCELEVKWRRADPVVARRARQREYYRAKGGKETRRNYYDKVAKQRRLVDYQRKTGRTEPRRWSE